MAMTTIKELAAEYIRAPLLTKEEEHTLLKNRNDPAARQKLIDANMRFVLRIALLFKDKAKAPMPALLEEGTKGLIEAIEKFDCEKHRTRFASYAVWWIRAGILKIV